jgi:tRNA(fMet)-specific endonuclease VapC
LPFDQPAAQQFLDLKAVRVRIGTMDLKIASIVLIHQATLLSANLRDFRQVPGLLVEDWLT